VTPRRLAPLALAVAAACGSATPTAQIRFQEPMAVAVFNGITVQTPGTVKPYFAVANAGRADLTLLDAVSGQAVAAPVVLRSLAIPTPSVRPSLLVSARLGDDQAPPPGQPQTHRPDLLVAVGAGSSQLELVSTWGADGAVSIPSAGVDLGAGSEILAAIATPVVESGAVASGRVRVIAALSGRQLAVVDYARTPTSTQPDAIAPVGPPVIVKLSFQPLALAIDPDEASGTPAALHLYAATLDPLTRPDGSTVFGVAMLDATLPPGDAWAVSPSLQAIDARAPTRLVAAATLEERKPDAAGSFPSSPPGLPSSPFQSPAVRRVYAFLDPSSCGPAQRIDCGIAVLDPTPTALRLVPDYSIGSPTTGTPMPYLAPIFVPSVPVALSISKPPAVPIDSNSTTGNQFAVQYMPLVAGTGVRATSAVAAIAAADGRVYIVDLSRWQIPSDVSILRDTAASPTRTRASAMATIGVVDQPDPRFFRSRELGVWDVTNPAKPALVVSATGDALSNINVVRVTPGFTPSDVWRIKYQGTLPGLSVRTAETGPTGGGGTWLAMQLTPTPGGTQIDVARLYDPTLAVQVGDIVIISAAELTSAQCAPLQATATAAALNVETQITAILAPSGAYPGGAVVVDPLNGPNGTTQWRDCFNAEIAGQAHSADKGSALRAEVIAGGYVMVGDQAGYAGRPVSAIDPNVGTPFALAYQNEDALSCPILPWPTPLPTATTDPFYACTDATCRSACDSLVLARKARRTYHLADACSPDNPGADARCFQVWPTAQYPFPQATGPVISFRLGLQERFVAAPGITATPPPTDYNSTPARGLELDLTTVDALSPTFRRAPAGSGDVVYPTGGITAFDRSPYKASDSYRFFVTFGSDFVLDFSPALAQNTGNVYR